MVAGGTHVEDERGYIMVYEGLSGGGDRNPGVGPVEYLWRPRDSYFYLVREIALAESSRETRKIYPRYFALSPAYPVLPSLALSLSFSLPPRASALTPHPALFIQRALSLSLPPLLVLDSVARSCARGFSRSFSSSSRQLGGGGGEKNGDGDVFHREKGGVPFILAR